MYTHLQVILSTVRSGHNGNTQVVQTGYSYPFLKRKRTFSIAHIKSLTGWWNVAYWNGIISSMPGGK